VIAVVDPALSSEPTPGGPVKINGKALDFALRAAGMSQAELAKRAEVSQGHISRAMRGQSGVGVDVYGRILNAFDRRLGWDELLAEE
jgi:transcriptional regulator with XRE-family HTH domain